jgi:hypothetical protein
MPCHTAQYANICLVWYLFVTLRDIIFGLFELGFVLFPCFTACFRCEAEFGKYTVFSLQLKNILCTM